VLLLLVALDIMARALAFWMLLYRRLRRRVDLDPLLEQTAAATTTAISILNKIHPNGNASQPKILQIQNRAAATATAAACCHWLSIFEADQALARLGR
jgi:hypothetical protein